MKKWKVCFCVFFVLCCLFTSCRTVETVTEYVPVELNVAELVKPIVDQRPADVVLIEDVQRLSDVMENSVAFQKAYADWRAYAITLEEFCLSLSSE